MSKSFIFSAVSAADLTDKEGYGVKADGAGKIALATATTDEIVGVIVQGAVAGEQVAVALPGATAAVKVSGAVKAFDAGKIAADGTFVVSAFAQNDVICVRFLEAGVSGDLPMALIQAAVKHA
jgi:hypothetical protein